MPCPIDMHPQTADRPLERGIHSASGPRRWGKTPGEPRLFQRAIPGSQERALQTKAARTRAFTLIELLVVVAIIAILASMALVGIAKIQEKGRRTEAVRQIHALHHAIEEYHADTGMYPVSDAALTQAMATHSDFTFNAPGTTPVNNSEVMAILLDRQSYPSGAATVNFNHARNKKQKIYLTDMVQADATNLPGLGPDLIYRDPWGTPYVMSFDLNFDDNCHDAFYARSLVSRDKSRAGFDNLLNSSDPTGASDDFQYHGGVMIWSLGTDKKADPLQKANAGVNRDNILSWR